MSFFENTRKPKGFGGRVMVAMMNFGHGAMAEWGLQQLDISPSACVLDAGCGGGANIKKLLKKCSKGAIKGIDYSDISVEKSRKVNAKEIESGRCEVFQANIMELPFSDTTFDAVTAFETVYFWPDILASFKEVWRVLKGNGTFLICNESNGETNKDDKWVQSIGGMTIYSGAQLKNIMIEAGFTNVEINKNGKGWLCVIARK